MESIETYHAEHIEKPLRRGSYDEMARRLNLIDCDLLPKLEKSLFTPNHRILWIEGHDINNNSDVWVPYELVHCDFTYPFPDGSGCFPLTSNGLASGGHLFEAISHGICEVVERDAVTLWKQLPLGEQHERRVDLQSIDDPDCCELMGRYDSAGIAVAIWELTSDIGLPVFLCTIIDRTPKHFATLYSASGMGCHPSRRIAMTRALTEAAQSRLTYISGARDDITQQRYQFSLRSDVNALLKEHLASSEGTRRFRDVPSFETDSLVEDVAVETEQLASAGFNQVVVIDLSREEFRIPVVRVIIPGLEGPDFHPALALGDRALRARAGQQ